MIERSKLKRVAFSKTMVVWLVFLLPYAAQAKQEPTNPENTQQSTDTNGQAAEILRRARSYADDYIQRLPNFICMQRTAQFEGNKKGSRWKEGDTISSKLVFSDGRERRTLAAINGNAPSPSSLSRRVRRPLTTNGEFGILLANVLGSNSDAVYQFRGWQALAGKNMAVFSYSIDLEHSTVKLTLSDLATAVVPYHGIIFADPADGKVWRISSEATDIPEKLDTRSIITVIDYQAVSIGGAEYLMPGKASVLMITRTGQVRNELSFSGFQKFETGSTITFGEAKDDQNNSTAPKSAPPQ